MITNKHDLKTCAGWLEKLKQRQAIRHLTITWEKLLSDNFAVQLSRKRFRNTEPVSLGHDAKSFFMPLSRQQAFPSPLHGEAYKKRAVH
jgi:hypothetical protein